MKYCVNCQNLLSDDSAFCPKCGLKADGVGICKECYRYVYYSGDGKLVETKIVNQNDWKYCPKCGTGMHADKGECPQCGTYMPMVEKCNSCGGSNDIDPVFAPTPTDSPSYQGGTYAGSASTVDVAPKKLSNGMAIAIKILLIVTLVSTFVGAAAYLLQVAILQDGGLDVVLDILLLTNPEIIQMIEGMDDVLATKIVTMYLIFEAVVNLIPLAWIFPMRHKILKAIKNGTKLKTGFKVCTLIFVNTVVGILLLVSKEI